MGRLSIALRTTIAAAAHTATSTVRDEHPARPGPPDGNRCQTAREDRAARASRNATDQLYPKS